MSDPTPAPADITVPITGAAPPRGKLLSSAEGTSAEAFGTAEWTTLLVIAAVWGSSFLFIAVGLEAFGPGVVALARVSLGALTLAAFPKARRGRIERQDRARVAVLGVVWIGIPMLLFPIAELWVSTSLAGMINGAVPLSSAFFAALLLRRMPARRQVAGLSVGFVGLVMVSWRAVQGSQATALGAALLVFAIILYGIALNLAVPLQQRYGSLPVLLRAQLVALLVIAPVGLWQLPDATWDLQSALAMIPLGALSTGLAFVLMTGLAGKVGASRAGVAIYFTPTFAIILGVLFRDESVAPLSLVGMAVVLFGAWLTTGRERRGPA